MTEKFDHKAKFDTLCLHGGQDPDPTTGARALPIYQTTSYQFKSTEHAANLFALKEFGNIYTRLMNPTTDVLEKRVALLEGGSGALATASGQSAITLALFNIVNSGEEIVSSASLYGGTYNLFKHTFARLGIKVNFVDPSVTDNFRKAITSKTKAIYAESLGNPKLDTLNFAEVSKIAHDAGIPLVIDNTITTPFLLRPFKHGADIIIHSLTKFLGGHGTSIGGIIVDSGKFNWANGNFPQFTEPDPSYQGLRFWDVFGNLTGFGNIAFIIKARVQLLRDIGAAISPVNSFLILQGVETLHLRMERHSKNALAVTNFLRGHSKVSWVNYPGLPDHPFYGLAKKYHEHDLYGALLGFGIKGGREAGKRFIENLKLISHLANIGDAKSLAIHPATTTHRQLTPEEQLSTGVSEDFIRLSIGLEDIDDIITDIDEALLNT